MKKLLLILLTFSTTSFAQNGSYSHFRDYFISLNIDSLQKVVDSQKNQPPLTYPHSLIELEMSRHFFANDFGKDLENIKSIAIQSKNQQVLAMYHLLKSMKFLRIDKKESLNSVLKAKEYFEQQKDTSGLISSNYMLLALFREPTTNYKDREKISAEVFKNTLSYYLQMNDVRDKLRIIMICISYGNFFEMKIDEQFTFYKIGVNLLIKHPEYNYLRNNLYTGAANIYFKMSDKNKDYLRQVQWCYLKAYQSLPSKPLYSTVTALYNLGYGYTYTKEYKQAEIYIKKAIALYYKLKMEKPGSLFEYYSKLSEVQYEQKDYKRAYNTRLKSEEVQKAMNEKLKSKEMQELLTKYETEKKDVLIKNLELQKQATEVRTRLILFILVLTCIIIAAVSFLAFRLREANKKLKKLTQSRDKLFTIIAHDLRGPLNSYQRYSEIVWYLIKTKQFDRLEDVLKKNDELGLSLAALLNNLLEWSIIQQKQIQITPTTINVQAFFNDLLPIYRDMANLKGLSLIEGFQDKDIKIDPHLLSLITRNLLDNAIKYTPEGNPIALQTTIKGDVFVMTISNRGCTMTPTQTEKIKSLFNDNNDYEFGEDGLGIGLILIKEFAKTNAIKIIFDHNVTITTFEVRVTNI